LKQGEKEMNDNMGIPPLEEPKKNNNRTLIIIIAVVVVLCCCCLVIGALGWQFGDQIMHQLGVY
jgi:hypothetical protein